MKIRSELRAGRTFDDCAKERDWWRKQAGLMEQWVESNRKTPPAGLWLPTAEHLPATPPTGSSGSYPDMSAVCGVCG